MSTGYTGLYVQKLSNGVVIGVYVKDGEGLCFPLNPDTYVKRKILPPMEQLPDQGVCLKKVRSVNE